MARKAKTITKSDFVRGFPPGTPAAEVVTAAKKKGLRLTDRYVYVIRSSDKAKARRGKVIGNSRHGRGRGGDSEAALRTAIAEVGLGRARQVFKDVEAAFA